MIDRLCGALSLISLIAITLVGTVGCTLKIGTPSSSRDQKPCPDGSCRPDGQDACPYHLVSWMDLPREMRERNWGGGSCVHASTVMVLRWQGHEELADWWRRTYSGGEHGQGLTSKCERAGLRFAYTNSGDEQFLEWVSRTRRGATIFYKPSHSICFCGYENGQAVLLDNNRIDVFERVEKQEFIRRWKGYGGFALTMVYQPPPPHLWRAEGGRQKAEVLHSALSLLR